MFGNINDQKNSLTKELLALEDGEEEKMALLRIFFFLVISSFVEKK